MSKPYQTTLRTIEIPGLEPLELYTLLDRQQYYDPKGAAERLGICSAAWPLFGMLWPSGYQLALKVAKYDFAAEQRVLEIGCGLALASLTAHQLGINITASDRHPLAKRFLYKNLEKNQLPLMSYRYGQWGQTGPVSVFDAGAPMLSGQYDVIIGSDLLYDPSSPQQVAEFIHQFAAPKADVWVMDPNRGYRNRFSRAMADYGFILAHDKKIQRPFQYDRAAEPQPYSGRFLVYKRQLVN